MPRKVTVEHEKILDSWGMLIDGGAGKGDTLLAWFMKFLRESNAPGIEVEAVEVRPSWLKGLLGKSREFLMVTNKGAKDFRMYVCVRDYGNDLDVSWFITCEPGFLKKRIIKSMVKAGNVDKAMNMILDILTWQDLAAGATCVHHSLLKAVEAIMRDLGQDPSTIQRRSRGFLGIS